MYIDCSSGVSGDMLLGAFLDFGINHADFIEKIKKIVNTNIKIKKVERNSLPATKVEFEGEVRYSVKDMINLIKKSSFKISLKRKSIDIIRSLEESEKKVHEGEIQYGEVWKSDTLIEVLGTSYFIEKLEIDKIISSPVNVGSPAPLTLEIIKKRKIPIFSDSKLELATPTGIAILSKIVDEFSYPEVFKVEKYGFGAGNLTTQNRPNLLRLVIGNSLLPNNITTDEVIMLQTNIDDMDPRVYPYLLDEILKLGALDSWYFPIYMKKGRLGVSFNVVCYQKNEEKIKNFIFNQTTTLGIRREVLKRYILKRKQLKGYKKVYLPDGRKLKRIEYENAVRLAKKYNKPLIELL